MSFPTTPILDNFNRADENPLSDGGAWSTTKLLSSGFILALISNQVVGSAATGSAYSSYWNAASFLDCEVYADIEVVANPALPAVTARSNNENSTNLNMYRNTYDGTSILIRKTLVNVTTLLQTTVVSLSVGDKIGLSVIGSNLTGYYNTSGVWSSVPVVVDTAIITAGHIGIVIGQSPINQVPLFDNFGGGTAVTGDTATLTGQWQLK